MTGMLMARCLGRNLLRLALGAVIFVGVMVAVMRALVAHTDLVDDWALQAIALATDKAAAAETISVRLHGLAPELTLRDVRLGKGERAIRLTSLALELDPWASLWQIGPVLDAIRLDGGHLRVTRFADGRIKVQGHEGNLLARMPFPDRVSLTNLTIDWRDGGPGAEPLKLRSVALHGGLAGGSAALSGRATIADNGGAVRLRANFDTPLSPGAPLDGHLHLALTRLDAQRVGERGSQWARNNLGLAGRLDGGVWLTWRQNRLVRATASGDWRDPAALGVEENGPITGSVRWQRQEGGWRLDAQGPATEAGEAARVSTARGPSKTHWRIGVRGLELGDWLAHLQEFEELPQRWRERLRRVEPRGHIRRLQLARRTSNWRVEADLAGLSVASGAGHPGIDNLDLSLGADSSGGKAELAVADSHLRWPAYLNQPAGLTAGRAQLRWRMPGGGETRLRLTELSFDGPLAAGRASGSLHKDADRESRLDGALRLSRGDASALLARLDSELLETASLTWLAQHLQGARLTGSVLRASGSVPELMAADSDSVWRLRSGFRIDQLDYAPAWPALTGLAGDFELSPEGLRVGIQRAQVAGLDLSEASARLSDWDLPRLAVDLEARAAFDDWLAALERTPLAPAAEAVGGLRLGGEPELGLSLAVPLDDAAGVSVDGTVTLNNASVSHPATGLELTRLRGEVGFDRYGLDWDGVTARLAGSRVTSNGWTVGNGDDARIRAIAQVDTGLAPWLPARAGKTLPVSGRASWLVDVTLPGLASETGRWRAELSSDLLGLAVDAPLPFGKAATAARTLSISARGGPSGIKPVRLQYGQRLRALAAIDSGRVTRAGVQLGGEPARLPEGLGLRVDGRLETLDGARLRAYSDLLGAGSRAGYILPRPLAVDLEVGALRAGGYVVRDVGVRLDRPKGGWRIRFEGPNARGALTTGEAGGFELDMARLAIERDGGRQPASLSPPSSLPAIEMRIDELRLDGRLLGQFRLRLQQGDQGISLRELALDNPSMLLRAEGDWDQTTDHSTLEVTTETVDTGGVLERFGLPARVRGGQGRFRADLSWDGHLFEPDAPTMAGTLELDLRDGSLPSVEPGTGRLLGLLSLSLLPRRMMLDFASITDEGLPFDRIYANFDVTEGMARPAPFYLVGPMARVQVSGPVDLVDRVYDQRITVIPRVSATLPLVGGLAGGAPAALLLWLGQDVVAQGMAPFTSISYRLTGPWSAPRIDRANRGALNSLPHEEAQ
jgi:uncharacterized protein (TIGR02099 family)